MSLIETLPRDIVINGDILFSTKADVDILGNFNEQWLVITTQSVFVLLACGESLNAISIDSISNAKIVNSIGGGSLVVDTHKGMIVLVRFTAQYK